MCKVSLVFKKKKEEVFAWSISLIPAALLIGTDSTLFFVRLLEALWPLLRATGSLWNQAEWVLEGDNSVLWAGSCRQAVGLLLGQRHTDGWTLELLIAILTALSAWLCSDPCLGDHGGHHFGVGNAECTNLNQAQFPKAEAAPRAQSGFLAPVLGTGSDFNT